MGTKAFCTGILDSESPAALLLVFTTSEERRPPVFYVNVKMWVADSPLSATQLLGVSKVKL